MIEMKTVGIFPTSGSDSAAKVGRVTPLILAALLTAGCPPKVIPPVIETQQKEMTTQQGAVIPKLIVHRVPRVKIDPQILIENVAQQYDLHLLNNSNTYIGAYHATLDEGNKFYASINGNITQITGDVVVLGVVRNNTKPILVESSLLPEQLQTNAVFYDETRKMLYYSVDGSKIYKALPADSSVVSVVHTEESTYAGKTVQVNFDTISSSISSVEEILGKIKTNYMTYFKEGLSIAGLDTNNIDWIKNIVDGKPNPIAVIQIGLPGYGEGTGDSAHLLISAQNENFEISNETYVTTVHELHHQLAEFPTFSGEGMTDILTHITIRGYNKIEGKNIPAAPSYLGQTKYDLLLFSVLDLQDVLKANFASAEIDFPAKASGSFNGFIDFMATVTFAQFSSGFSPANYFSLLTPAGAVQNAVQLYTRIFDTPTLSASDFQFDAFDVPWSYKIPYSNLSEATQQKYAPILEILEFLSSDRTLTFEKRQLAAELVLFAASKYVEYYNSLSENDRLSDACKQEAIFIGNLGWDVQDKFLMSNRELGQKISGIQIPTGKDIDPKSLQIPRFSRIENVYSQQNTYVVQYGDDSWGATFNDLLYRNQRFFFDIERPGKEVVIDRSSGVPTINGLTVNYSIGTN